MPKSKESQTLCANLFLQPLVASSCVGKVENLPRKLPHSFIFAVISSSSSPLPNSETYFTSEKVTRSKLATLGGDISHLRVPAPISTSLMSYCLLRRPIRAHHPVSVPKQCPLKTKTKAWQCLRQVIWQTQRLPTSFIHTPVSCLSTVHHTKSDRKFSFLINFGDMSEAATILRESPLLKQMKDFCPHTVRHINAYWIVLYNSMQPIVRQKPKLFIPQFMALYDTQSFTFQPVECYASP